MPQTESTELKCVRFLKHNTEKCSAILKDATKFVK